MEEGGNLMELPVELLHNVVARLPFPSLIRVSAACKTFYGLVRSPEVARRRRTLPAPPWNCLAASDSPGTGLVLLAGCRMSVAALPSSVPPYIHQTVASAGPFLCCRNRYRKDQLWICNPFMATRQLPSLPFPLLDDSFLSAGMTFHPSSGLYTVIAVVSHLPDSKILSTFQFCPQEDSNRWSEIKLESSSATDFRLGNLLSPPCSDESTILWPAIAKGHAVTFNTETQRWHVIGARPLIDLSQDKIIVACGRILMVGYGIFTFQSMTIWELNNMSECWRFISVLPGELWRRGAGMSASEEADEMEPHSADEMDPHMITSWGKLVFIIPPSRNHMFIFDLEQTSWELVEGLHPMVASLTNPHFLPLQPGFDLP